VSLRSPNSAVVGVDLSLTSTGLARITWMDHSPRIEVWRLKTKLKGFDRLDFILDALAQWTQDARLVVVEGLAFAAHDTGRQGAGLHWLVRHGLWRGEIPTAVCPPTVRAKYACGKGNGGKDEVLAAVIRRYGVPLDVAVDGNDVADALTMAAMGARWLGRPIEERIPEVNASVLDKVEWPA
jgi:crossover junction endodeoxyribonuclease RuvC